MSPRTYTPASGSLLDSRHDSSLSEAVGPLRGLMVLALAVLLSPMGQAELFAQQAPDQGQYPSNQQLPDQQSGYGQPGYAQPQSEGQPAYPPQSYPPQSYPAPGQMSPQPGSAAIEPLGAQQLQQLVAPIALYPDTLVAQVLTAATYPAQVADADRWRRTQGYASSDQIAAGADAQSWDPSVKALTAFPQVLEQMNYNLQWTTQLGNAYYNQPQDVLEAVQGMRQRAQAAGNLRSTPQETVNYDQGNIVLAPVSPQVMYVPVYNPWAVYGQPVAPYPGFSLLGALGSFIGSSIGPLAVRFGLGIATTAFMHTPFGLLAWGLDWLAHSVLFHGSNYYSHSTTVADWGFPHGGPRAFSRGGWSVARSNNAYRAAAGYGRPTGGYTARSQAFARTSDRSAYAGNRPAGAYNRGGYQRPGTGYGRSSAGTYNSVRPATARPQEYGRSSYGSSSYGRSTESYSSGRGATYGGRRPDYRAAPSANFQRSKFGKPPSGKPAHSGGFHRFGGGHGAKSFSGGKSFGRGHSGGGGHSGHSGGKHHR
jgi:hypothetical protein